MLKTELTLQETAHELGVHYMTAYRYVRLGLLPAAKQGGIWQVRRGDLDGFRAGSTTTPVSAGHRAPWAERLESRLMAGDARGAWSVVEAALTAGTELDEIYLDVLSPALVAIGARWEAGEIDVAVEHRSTVIAMRLIGRLGPRCVRRGRTRGALVVGAPAGEFHALPAAIVADLLRLEGWDVSDLGADVPAPSFAHAVQTTDHLVGVGISVTGAANLAAAAEACAAVRDVAPGIFVVVGGLAVSGVVHAHELGAEGFAGSAKEMMALLGRRNAPA